MKAGPADDWSELMKSVELNPWMMAKLQAKRSRSTISASALCSNSCTRARTSCGHSSWQMKDREGSHCRTCAHTVNAIRLKTTSGGSRRRIVTASRGRRSSVTGGCAACGGQYQQCGPQRDEGVSGPRFTKGACENLVGALQMQANLETGGGNILDTISEGLQWQSRLKIMSSSRWTTTKR